MTDQNAIYQSRAGSFATSRKGGVAADAEFILEQRSKGVPASAVARMIGRAEADVRLIYGVSCAAQEGEAPAAPLPVWRQSKPRPSRAKLVGIKQRRAPSRPAPRELSAEARKIALEVAAKHGLTLETLCGADDKRVFYLARREAWHAIYATGRYSLPLVGAWFGGRNHTTIRTGIRKHAEALAVQQADVEAWNALGTNSTKREAA